MDAHPMIDFIRNHPVASLATIDGDAARCRGFLTNLIDEKLYFTTGASKAVYSQLLAHPNVELAYFSPDFSHALRVRGTVTFDDDRTKKAQLIQQRDYLKGFTQMTRSLSSFTSETPRDAFGPWRTISKKQPFPGFR